MLRYRYPGSFSYKLVNTGIWINCGPLLWTGGGQAKIELSLEEILDVSETIGFILDSERSTKVTPVKCEYTADKEAMMKWMYEAQLWVARKPK